MQNHIDSIRTAMYTFGSVADESSNDDVQEALVSQLIDIGSWNDLPDVGTTKLSKEQAKWRAISSLQKAVRRGHTQNALMMCTALINGGQEDHLIKRMCTIALEDVAFGDPVLCAQVFAFAASAKIRSKVGGWTVFLELVTRMCAATKDRIPCEIAVTAGFSPEDDDYKRELYAMDHDVLVDYATNWQQHHWQDVQTATRFLSGHMKMGADFLNNHRDMTAFRAAFNDCPPLLRYIAHRSAAGGGESAALVSGMRLGWHLLYANDDADPVGLEAQPLDAAQIVKAVLLEALDMHTQEGKSAFKKLLANEGAAFAGWVDDLGGSPLEALGNGVFMVEGKLCNERWWSPDTDQITHLSHEAQMGRAGLPKAELSKLLVEVTALLPALNEHRTKILTG